MDYDKINGMAAAAFGVAPLKKCFSCGKPVYADQAGYELFDGEVMHAACRDALEDRLATIRELEIEQEVWE